MYIPPKESRVKRFSQMKTKLANTQKVILLVAGSLLILVSGWILASPTDFYAANEIELGANPSLLNELKAPAGLLLSVGLFMIGMPGSKFNFIII